MKRPDGKSYDEWRAELRQQDKELRQRKRGVQVWYSPMGTATKDLLQASMRSILNKSK